MYRNATGVGAPARVALQTTTHTEVAVMWIKRRSGQESSGRVRKDLDDADRTDSHRTGHYSREDVLAACHATDGDSHE